MSDFSDDLARQLRNNVADKLRHDPVVQDLLKRILESVDYTDAYEYAHAYGGYIAEALTELGVSEWMFGTAMEVWEPTIIELHKEVGSICATVQKNKNTASGIGLKPQTVKYNQYDVKDIVAKAVEDFGLARQEVEKYADKCVDDNQTANINFAINTGGTVEVTRTYDGIGLRRGTKQAETCEWCLARVGTYQFSTTTECANSGIFNRHPGCGCTIDYKRIG